LAEKAKGCCVNMKEEIDNADPAFLADIMLGKLARWLRILGYDTSYARGLDDSRILTDAVREGRIILTRDRELSMRAAPDSLYVESTDISRQLEQISIKYRLKFREDRMRCSICNSALDQCIAEEVRNALPEDIVRRHTLFYRCAGCGHLYWKGSHWDAIIVRLKSATGDEDRKMVAH